MPETLFIDTNTLPRSATPGGGEMTEILNGPLAGAKNVLGTLRWLRSGETFETPVESKHQLLYVMEGEGAITLDGKTHDVTKGMGLYLAPAERATISGRGPAMKLFHLVVPQIPK